MSTIVIERAVVEQALEAMLHYPGDISDEMFESIRALKAALAQKRIEPTLDDAMREPRAMAQAYEAGWNAALARLEQVGWMQRSTGVIRCDWGFDTSGYVPVYTIPTQEQPE